MSEDWTGVSGMWAGYRRTYGDTYDTTLEYLRTPLSTTGGIEVEDAGTGVVTAVRHGAVVGTAHRYAAEDGNRWEVFTAAGRRINRNATANEAWRMLNSLPDPTISEVSE